MTVAPRSPPERIVELFLRLLGEPSGLHRNGEPFRLIPGRTLSSADGFVLASVPGRCYPEDVGGFQQQSVSSRSSGLRPASIKARSAPICTNEGELQEVLTERRHEHHERVTLFSARHRADSESFDQLSSCAKEQIDLQLEI